MKRPKKRGLDRVNEIIEELKSPHVSLDDVIPFSREISKILLRRKCPEYFLEERKIKLAKARQKLWLYVYRWDTPPLNLDRRNEDIRRGAVRILLSVVDILYNNE